MEQLSPDIVRAIDFRLRKLEDLHRAVENLISDGIAGRGRTIEDHEGKSETVEIKHSFWLELLRTNGIAKM